MTTPVHSNKRTLTTTVKIPEEDKTLLSLIGYENFSEFIRDCVAGALADPEEICPECGNIISQKRLRAIKIGQELIRKKSEQRHIIEEQQSAQEQLEEYRKKREDAISQVFIKIRPSLLKRVFSKPDDYEDEISQISKNVSTKVGTEVLFHELKAVYDRCYS